MDNILSLPPASVGLAAGSSEVALVGTGDSAPSGVESVFIYNSTYLNIRDWLDTFIVSGIEGLGDADVRDTRDVNPGRHGETYFEAFYGGRTIVLTGKVRAFTIAKLRDMQQALRQTFSDLTAEQPLTIKNSYLGRDVMINCKKSAPLVMGETQGDYTFIRDFQVTLRASNPRFLSTTRKTDSSSFFIEDMFNTAPTARFTNLILNPSFLNPSSATSGWSASTNATLTSSTAAGAYGNNYGIATSSAAGNWQINYQDVSLSAGSVTVQGSAYVRVPGTNRTVSLILEFRDAANTIVGTSTSGNLTTTTGFAQLNYSAVAPATANKVRFYVRGNAAAAAGEIFHVDAAMVVESPNSPGLYFDGDQPMTVWSGTPHNSISRKMRGSANWIVNPDAGVNTTGWTPGSTAGATVAATISRFADATFGDGGFVFRITGTNGTATQRDFFATNAAVQVAPGASYTLSMDVSVVDGVSDGVRIGIFWFDSLGGFISQSVSATSYTGGTTGTSRLSVTAAAPANAATAQVFIGGLTSTANDTVDLRFDVVTFVEGTTAMRFTGNTTGDRWFGTPSASVSESFDDDGFSLNGGSWTMDSDGPGAFMPAGTSLHFRPASTTIQRRAYKNNIGYRPINTFGILKVTTPLTSFNGNNNLGVLGIIPKRIDKDNLIECGLLWNGTNHQLVAYKYDAGVKTSIGTPVTLPALSVNTSYWFAGYMSGNNVSAALYSNDPVQNASPTVVGSFTYNLSSSGTPSEVTKYGAAVVGDSGIFVENFPLNDYLLDDYFAQTLSTSALVIGTLANEGNFNAEPLITLTGPMTNPAIINETTGQTMGFTGTIPAGSTWTIDASKRTIVNQAGVSQFDKLNVTSDWIDIKPGNNVIDFTASSMAATRTGAGVPATGSAMAIQHYDTWM